MAICASKISIARAKAIFTFPAWGTKRSPPFRFKCRRMITSVPYYRDRALVLGRGVSSRQLAIDYFAKRKGESHGRQMPSHYSCAEKHIWSVPTPTGSQLLPACGIAWGIKLDGKNSCCRRDGWRCRHPPGRFLRSDLFREGEEIADACSSSRTTLTASAVRPAKSIRARSMCFSRTIGSELDGADVGEMYEAGRESIRSHARRQRTGVFLGDDGAAFQSHQLRRPETLSQRGRTEKM